MKGFRIAKGAGGAMPAARRLGSCLTAALATAALAATLPPAANPARTAPSGAAALPSPGEAPTGSQTRQDPFRIQVQVEAVSLSVAVSDRRGRFVSGLTAEDFVVREDGVPQKLTFFQAEAAPLTILVLLDASLSMRVSLDYVKEAAATFVERLWEGDRAMIGEFNDRVRFGGEFTEDRRRLTSSIFALNPLGPTALYDASILALERLHFSDGDRKVLLVFTDGDDSRNMGFGSEASAGDAIEAARLTDSVVYAIGFEGNGARVNKRFLRRLASETGGQALFPERTGDLIGSFERIEADMHAQYRLAYLPRNAEQDGAWRELKVEVRGRRDLTARTRNGYYAIRRGE